MKYSLAKINKAGLKFLESSTLQETYVSIVNEALRLVSGESGGIVREESGSFKLIYESSSKIPPVKPRKKGHTYKALRARKIIIIQEKELIRTHPEMVEAGIKSAIFIPLFYKKKSVGVLVIRSSEDNHFTEQSIEHEILKIFSSMACLAIIKAQSFEETKKALKVRDLFISMAAHEFRTPLTSINGYIQLLHNKLSKGNAQESKWVQHLYGESARLTNLVKELLEINHIQSGKLQYFFKECDLDSVIAQAINGFHFIYPDRRVIYKNYLSNKTSLIIGDAEKLLQAIRNLMENAAKYSSSDKDIHVKLRQVHSFLNLSIIDAGIGIPKNEIPQIFKGFYKGTSSVEEGMGLGLYLARNIVNSHHGSINILSKVGKGTIVEVKLPRIKL